MMQEGNVSVEGVTYKIEQPFMVMATQNPIEHLGTYPLPEAQLDRFFMKIQMGYPSNQDEAHIVKQQMNSHFIKQLKPVATKKDILRIQEEVSNVHIEDSLALYIVGVANETRNNQDILLGVSPRGSIALGRASQAFAYLAGRNYVLPEDVKSAAIPVLRHRIILNKEAKIRRVQPEEVIESILSKVNIGM
jgi:MoxR-like ATPase